MTKSLARWYAVYAVTMGVSWFVLLSMGEFLLAGFAFVHAAYAIHGFAKATDDGSSK